MASFIDVEQALCEVLAEIAPTYTVTTAETPQPLIQINRTGGYRRPWQDSASVVITVVGSSRDESIQLDRQLSDLIGDAYLVPTSQGLLDRIQPSNAPMPVPFPSATDDREITSSWVVISRLQ